MQNFKQLYQELKQIEFRSLNIKTIGSWPESLRLIIIGLLFIVIVYFGFKHIHQSAVNKIDNLHNQFKKMQTDYINKYNTISQLKQYQTEIDNLNSITTLLKQQLPTSNPTAKLIEYLSAITTKYNLLSRSIVPGDVFQQKSISSIPIDIELEGKFVDILAFIDNVMRGNFLTTFSELTLEQKISVEEDKNLTFKAKLNVYWQSTNV